MKLSSLLLALAAFVSLVATPAAAAPEWALEEGSRVGFVATQGGAPVEGAFTVFEARIASTYDVAISHKSRG